MSLKKVFRNIKNGFKHLFVINVLKTIVLNFRLLSFEQAVHLPIWLYGKIDIRDCNGRLTFRDKAVRGGMWRIGCNSNRTFGYNTTPNVTRLAIQGECVLGDCGKIMNGGIICVHPKGKLILGTNVEIGPLSKIVVDQNVTLGNEISISWECQIFDTNFHAMVAPDGFVTEKSSSVVIGSHCWIGNRVTIGKGTFLNDWSIVASNSLVNKNFSNVSNGTFGGVPAKLLVTGYKRMF